MIRQRTGHSDMTEKLGAGGMGEVYRARDRKLTCHFVLHVFPLAPTQDSQRSSSLDRRSQALDSLSRSRIPRNHGCEEVDDKLEDRA